MRRLLLWFGAATGLAGHATFAGDLPNPSEPGHARQFLAAAIIRSAMTSSTTLGWPVSSSSLQAASKASLITAIASGSNSPGFTNDRIDIAATPTAANRLP